MDRTREESSDEIVLTLRILKSGSPEPFAQVESSVELLKLELNWNRLTWSNALFPVSTFQMPNKFHSRQVALNRK